MSTDAIFAVTRAGLDYERTRMEAASRRIAMADSSAPGIQGTAKAAAKGFAEKLADGPGAVGVEAAQAMADGGDAGDAASSADTASTERADDAGRNPLSDLVDERGPDTDLALEMTDLMSAQRAYQADIRAFNVLHGMLLKSLTIGSR